MSDYTVDTHGSGTGHQVHRTPRVEFFVYFSVIFLATIPFTLVAWVVQVLRSRALPERGPFARAWSEARVITPSIFRP